MDCVVIVRYSQPLLAVRNKCDCPLKGQLLVDPEMAIEANLGSTYFDEVWAGESDSM